MKEQPIYTSVFWRLSFGALLFITSFNLLIPVLNDIIASYGGTAEKGFTIAFFATAALIARPFSGKLVDHIGRKPVIIFGSIVCIVIGILYTFLDGMVMFLVLRFFHGFSTGFTPVGNTSYLADIAPPHRRGEAMGIMGVMTSLGFAIGPYVGGIIQTKMGENAVFIASAVIALIAVLLVMTLPEPLLNRQKLNRKHFIVKKEEMFERKIIIPFTLMILTIYSFGANLIGVIDQAVELGFRGEMQGVFFLVYAVSSIMVRVLAGRVSDRYGRRNVMIAGMTLMAISLFILALATNKSEFICGAAIFGLAVGTNSPTIFAWAMDLADSDRTGRAMSTMFIAVEIGIIFGSLITGALLDIGQNAFLYIHGISALLCALGVVITLFVKRDIPPSLQ